MRKVAVFEEGEGRCKHLSVALYRDVTGVSVLPISRN